LSLSSPGWQRRGLFRVASCFMVQSREGEKVPRERGGFSSSSPRTSITPLEARGKVNWREIWGVSHRLGICFPCLQIQVFVDGQRKDGFVTNGEPQKEIDATLQAAGVKLPKSAKKCYQVIDLLSGHDAEGWVVPRPPKGGIWRRIAVFNVAAMTADRELQFSHGVLDPPLLQKALGYCRELIYEELPRPLRT